MIKISLGKLFQYNSELDMFRLFGKIEVWWLGDGTWYHPREWSFAYDHTTACGCWILDIAWFGISFLGPDCKGRYDL